MVVIAVVDAPYPRISALHCDKEKCRNYGSRVDVVRNAGTIEPIGSSTELIY